MTKTILAALVGAMMAFGPTGAAMGSERDAVADGARKINLHGRQAMLVQRMAQTACLAAAGVEVEAQRTALADARERFDHTLRSLRTGDEAQGLLLPERDEEIMVQLNAVSRPWREYERAVEDAMAAPEITREQVAALAELTPPVLEGTERAADRATTVYVPAGIAFHVATALKVSDRVRTLSQAVAKDVCLVARGIDAEAGRASLSRAIGDVDAGLAALRDGAADLGLRPPRGADLTAELDAVLAEWATLRPVYLAAAEGGAPAIAELVSVSRHNNRLLAALDRAVFLYEAE